jgi:aldehyde dehydrogenase (NAD+)
MPDIEEIYIDGRFVTPHGVERLTLIDPVTEEPTGEVRLADQIDARAAVAAARRAAPAFGRTTVEERTAILQRLGDAVEKRLGDLSEAMIAEYGGTRTFVELTVPHASAVFRATATELEAFGLVRPAGRAEVTMVPVGVAALITPWNHTPGFVATKIAHALAAGCTTVVKPSELSACQTQILTEAFDEADLPPGLVNVVTGRGDVVGDVLTTHPDIAKVSFTGSTAVGRRILHNAAETMKRVTLELGGKSPAVLLPDVDLEKAIPHVLANGFVSNGQACFAGTRILAPRSRLDEVLGALEAAVPTVTVGDPRDPDTAMGPLVNSTQFERVQGYLRLATEEGARVLIGGEGRPDGFDRGYFTRPTVLADVTNDMRIAREEIFGPVLAVIAYDDDEQAVAIANDSPYGLRGYVYSEDAQRARAVADRLEVGSVLINGAVDDTQAPFGGFKQSGIGREYGPYGLSAYLEPRAVLV